MPQVKPNLTIQPSPQQQPQQSNQQQQQQTSATMRASLSHLLKYCARTIENKMICPQCAREFKNMNSLRAHLSQDCGKEAKFQCAFCPSQFKRKYHLQQHYAVHRNALLHVFPKKEPIN